jgi:rhodanese-related sulfurtransferase
MLDFGAFKSLSTKEFQQKKEEGFAVIDVRRVDEWEYYGIIEGSHTITFFDERGRYDLDAFLEAFTKVVTSKEQPFILVCAHAQRTKMIGEMLGLKLKYKNVYELDGGINWGWIDQGLETVKM